MPKRDFKKQLDLRLKRVDEAINYIMHLDWKRIQARVKINRCDIGSREYFDDYIANSYFDECNIEKADSRLIDIEHRINDIQSDLGIEKNRLIKIKQTKEYQSHGKKTKSNN